LGVVLGARAVRYQFGNYNDGMTIGLIVELRKLGIQPASIAKESSEKMRGRWFTDGMGVKVLMRNMDLGLDDGYVSPVLVPDICPESLPAPYRIPRLTSAAKYGFSVNLDIKCREAAGHRCLDIIYPDGQDGLIHPSIHLRAIMQVARNQALEKGFDVVPKTQKSEPLLSDSRLNKDSLLVDYVAR